MPASQNAKYITSAHNIALPPEIVTALWELLMKTSPQQCQQSASIVHVMDQHQLDCEHTCATQQRSPGVWPEKENANNSPVRTKLPSWPISNAQL